MQMFIPMREPGEVGHWYLLVVHVKDKVAEILYSAPNKVKEYKRLEAARLAVKLGFINCNNLVCIVSSRRALLFRQNLKIEQH